VNPFMSGEPEAGWYFSLDARNVTARAAREK
jgi:hypothetical protein